MRDARVEEVEHVSDSDSEEREDAAQDQARLTVAIYPAHQGPTYLILSGKPERDNWLYHLTVVSGGGPSAGTQYEQLVQKLMETDGDPSEYSTRGDIMHLPSTLPLTRRLCTLASSDPAAHQRHHHSAAVIHAHGDNAAGSYQAIQGR